MQETAGAPVIKGFAEQVRDEVQLSEDALHHAAEALVIQGLAEQGRDGGQRSEVTCRRLQRL